MRNEHPFTRARHQQGGYALLLVVFLTALLVVGTMSIGLKILTEGKREKEQEMLWRGQQYTRGIKLYYRKLGRFPNSLEDLTKPKVGNIRFMRQPYKDPMNKEDGTWRLIYVGPAGNLIGSLNPAVSSVQMPGPLGQPAAPANGTTGIGGQPPGSGATTGFGSTSPSGPGNTPGTTGTSLTTGTGTTGTGTPTTGSGATGTDAQQVPTGDTPTIVGGNIIGVGSKINQPSVMVFEKAQNYRLFEFIWDPSKELAGAIISTPQAAPPNGTAPGTPGQPGSSTAPNPMNPQTPPTAAPPNPNPQQ